MARYRVGRDLIATSMTTDGVWLEGRLRLRPGCVVELTDLPSLSGPRERRAFVESWAVATLGKNGPVYCGKCTWLQPAG